MEQSIKTGYNDLDLLKSLELQEKQDMFNIIGLSTKPGHLLKFKKVIASYDSSRLTASDKEIPRELDNIPPKVQKSKLLSLICYNYHYQLQDNIHFSVEVIYVCIIYTVYAFYKVKCPYVF